MTVPRSLAIGLAVLAGALAVVAIDSLAQGPGRGSSHASWKSAPTTRSSSAPRRQGFPNHAAWTKYIEFPVGRSPLPDACMDSREEDESTPNRRSY